MDGGSLSAPVVMSTSLYLSIWHSDSVNLDNNAHACLFTQWVLLYCIASHRIVLYCMSVYQVSAGVSNCACVLVGHKQCWRAHGIHVNLERSFRGTNGDPPSEASQLRKGGPEVLPRKFSKTYIANGAISVIPELY